MPNLLTRKVPSALAHRLYKVEQFESDYGYYSERVKTTIDDASVVSSEVDVAGTVLHAPVLDIDWPCALVESSTPGHFHLYIDKTMSWWRYKRLLKALDKAGIIEHGYRKASLARKGTHLRLPWVKKAA